MLLNHCIPRTHRIRSNATGSNHVRRLTKPSIYESMRALLTAIIRNSNTVLDRACRRWYLALTAYCASLTAYVMSVVVLFSSMRPAGLGKHDPQRGSFGDSRTLSLYNCTGGTACCSHFPVRLLRIKPCSLQEHAQCCTSVQHLGN